MQNKGTNALELMSHLKNYYKFIQLMIKYTLAKGGC
jgi:hypothetical protein